MLNTIRKNLIRAFVSTTLTLRVPVHVNLHLQPSLLFPSPFTNCMTVSEYHLCVIWLLSHVVHFRANKSPNSNLLCSVSMWTSPLSSCTFSLPPSDCLFVFSPLLPFLSSSPPRLLLVLLCLVAAAEECTLSGLTRSPLKASELLAAASGNTTRSPEPCSGTAGSPFAHRSCQSQKHWSTLMLMLKNCKNFFF